MAQNRIQEPARNTVARFISIFSHTENRKQFNVPSEEEIAKLPQDRASLRAFAKKYVAQGRHIVK